MSVFGHIMNGLVRLLGLIATVLRYLIVTVLGLIVVGVGVFLWMLWHPRVTVPLDGTNLVIVYHLDDGFDGAQEHFILTEASEPGRPLSEARSEIYKNTLIGADLWRTPDKSAFYVWPQSGPYRIDAAIHTRNGRAFDYRRNGDAAW